MPAIDLTPYYQPPASTSDGTKYDNALALIQSTLNGIDNNNFAAGKIFDLAKLMQGGGTLGQGLVWNGTDWAPTAVVQSKYRKTTAKTVVSTVAETDLLNGEITVGANVIGATGILRVTAWGDWKQNSGGATDIPRFKLKLGSSTLLDTSVMAANVAANSANRFGWRICCEIQNLGAANSQWGTITVDLPMAGGGTFGVANFATGEGIIQTVLSTAAQTNMVKMVGGNSSAVDTSASVALVLSVILPTASANTEIVLKGAVVEVA